MAGSIFDTLVAGEFCYALDVSLGMHVLNVGDPTQRFRVGGNTTFWSGRDLALANNNLYVLTDHFRPDAGGTCPRSNRAGIRGG